MFVSVVVEKGRTEGQRWHGGVKERVTEVRTEYEERIIVRNKEENRA
jgi:hypothetical protein